MKTSTKKSKKKYLVLVIIIILLLIGGWLVYASTTNTWPYSDTSDTTPTNQTEEEVRPPNSVNYDPPTKEEEATNQEGKKNSTQQQEKPTVSEGLKSVSVGVAFADVINGTVEIRAFVTQAIEGTGKCTATLTKGSLTITRSSEAFIDASSSQCRPIIIPLSEFQSGSWKLSVSYLSNTHKGTSEVLEVTVP